MNMEAWPKCFDGWPREMVRPSSFPWSMTDVFEPPKKQNTARLEYCEGWTVVIFWNHAVYFADAVITFDGMIELIRERFDKLYLRASITRDWEPEIDA